MYTIADFVFEDKETAMLAKKEAEGIKLMCSQIELQNPQMVLQLYNKLLDKAVFQTPVGCSFMEELHHILMQFPSMDTSQVRPLPSYVAKVMKTARQAGQVQNMAQEKSVAKAKSDRQKMQDELELQKLKQNIEYRQNQPEQVSNKMKKVTEKATAQKNTDFEKAFHISLFFLMVALAALLGIFAITYYSGNNVNILNYENELVNKYAEWEKELKEKEAELLERERAVQEKEAQLQTDVFDEGGTTDE